MKVKRKRERKTVSNREKIVETGTKLFRFFGYRGTSIDMLIKTAGVSKSNFYYYFESKEELGLEVLGNLLSSQEKFISEILLNTDLNPLERMVKFYGVAIYSQRELFLESGSFFAKMALEQGSINEKFRSVVEMYFQKTEAALEVCVRECMDRGFLYERINEKLLPKYLIAQVKGAMIMAKVYNSCVPLEEAYEGTKNLLVKEEWRHLTPKL